MLVFFKICQEVGSFSKYDEHEVRRTRRHVNFIADVNCR